MVSPSCAHRHRDRWRSTYFKIPLALLANPERKHLLEKTQEQFIAASPRCAPGWREAGVEIGDAFTPEQEKAFVDATSACSNAY